MDVGGGLAAARLWRGYRSCGYASAALLLAATPRWGRVAVALLDL